MVMSMRLRLGLARSDDAVDGSWRQCDLPPEPGFARREARKDRTDKEAAPLRRLLVRSHRGCVGKEGVHGGTRGSPVHRERARLVRATEAEVGRPLALIADLQGPKLRIGELDGPVRLTRGEDVVVAGGESSSDGELSVSPAVISEVLQ